MGAAMPDLAAGLVIAMATVVDVRKRLDRVEAILARTIRIRGMAKRNLAMAQATADDAFDRVIDANRSAVTSRGNEYSSARERAAEANLATLDLIHRARHAAASASICDDAVEVVRLSWRGLDGLRQDLQTIMRSMAFESNLER